MKKQIKSKKGDGTSIQRLVVLFIVLFVGIVVIWALIYFAKPIFDTYNGLPSWDKTNRTYSGFEKPGYDVIYFEFYQGKVTSFPYISVIPISYSYFNTSGYVSGWYWYADDKWYQVEAPEIKTDKGNVPLPENKLFIMSLRYKTFEEGVKMLAIRTLENKEGGMFNADLIVYINDKKYNYDKKLLKDPDQFIATLKRAAGISDE